MIAQTVLSSDLNQTPLVLNGDFDSLGTYLDMVHGGRANTPMGLDIEFDEFEIRADFKYRSQRREIEIVRWELFENGKAIFYYASRKDSFEVKLLGTSIEKLLPGMRKQRPLFRNLLPSNPNFSLFIMKRAREDTEISEKVLNQVRKAERALVRARINLRRIFMQFDSLSPFRAKPERTYLYSGVTAERIGTTGANTATLMASDSSKRGSESKGLQAAVSNWFQQSGIAQSIRIDSISPRHFEIVLEDFNGGTHNISDVGFGCSQVLPVLTAALNVYRGRRPSPSSLFLVQEPEIHLHPNAKASLGSFFAGIVPEGGQLFIETHSDNLILRMARHVSDGTINANDFRLFYVHKHDGSSRVHAIEVSKEGYFSTDWPGGFFPQRQSESLALSQQSEKAKEKSRQEIQLIFDLPREAFQ